MLDSVGHISRVEGAVLGAAIGDAMGHPTEFLGHDEIRRRFPPDGVEGYELWWEGDRGRFAPYTDDTQMAEIVLRSLVRSRASGSDLDATMEDIAAGFREWLVRPQGGHRAPGNACMAGARALTRGAHWSEAGGATAGGCGSVMRAYPFGIVFADDPVKAERWAVEHSKLTHRDPIALAACAAMACAMCAAVAGEDVERILAVMPEAAGRYDTRTAEMIERAIADGLSGAAPDDVLRRLEGWAAHEAIAAAAFVVARHPEDARRAILEGANAHGDSDSIATLAGAVLGARHGIGALPGDWVRDVERSDELRALAGEASRAAGSRRA
ncbi:MAG TPA: ADP-ribosylglycohydrolase family protein [Tepidiformaceae bacterium]|nr:ADP-ribosylglycohydrolase family protein [Tepidiformaceae bacterium]